MRNMMFARTFPMTHLQKGQPTWFVEKIWACLADKGVLMDEQDFTGLPVDFHQYYNAFPKGHTIRAGNRWKVGDFFVPRVWSGLPYRSKTIQFAPAIEVKKVWDIKFDQCGVVSINGFYDHSPIMERDDFIEILARNDGLSEYDFHCWFPLGKEFIGQIICWNESIEY